MTEGTKSGRKMSAKLRTVLIAAAAAILVIVGVVAVFLLQGGLYPAEGAAEEQLRQQLLDSSTQEITVSGVLYLHGPVEVVGEKTILGDGKLKAVGPWEGNADSYVLVLRDGASLTLGQSAVVDGNVRAGGVLVPENTSLLVQEEASVRKAAAQQCNVMASGSFTMAGGSLKDAKGHNLYVTGTALLDGGNVSGSGKDHAGVYVTGTLEQVGGIVSDAYDNVYIAENGSFTWSGGENNDSDNDGIVVSAGAKLHSTSLEAIMNDAGRQGIHVYGEAALDDIFLNASGVNQILVEKEGVLTLNNGAIDGSKGNGITNRGTMTMVGGEITNSAQCGIVCSGELTVTGGRVYASTDQGLLLRNGSKATISGNGFSATGNSMGILVEENAYAEVFDCNINSNDLYNFGCYGELYIHDLTTGGSGSNCINTHYSGHVIAEDVTISGTAANNGIYNCNGSVVELTNVVIDSTKSNGIRNLDATLIAKNLTISNAGGHGISMSDYDFQGAGNVQLENLTMEGNEKANISLETDCSGTMQITNATLGKAGSNNISAKGGHLILTDVDVLGNVEKDASNHGIMLDEGCKITATNLLIQDVLKSGMRIRGGDFTGTNVTIKNTPVSGISSVTGPTNKRNGNINISGLTITGAKENTINSDCDGVIVVTGGTLGATWSNNVRINKGSVTLNNVKVLGNTANTKSKSEHGVFISHGVLNMKDVTIANAKAAGLRFGGGTVKAENVTISNSGSSGIYATSVQGEPAGVMTAKNLVITGSGDTNISNSGKTSITINGGRMDPAYSNNVRINDGFVRLENVEVVGQAEKNLDGTQHGVFITQGQLELKNVAVKNAEGAGLRVGGGTVTGEKLTIENSGGSGIYNTSVEGQEGATVTLTDVTVSGSADTNISNLGDVTISVTNAVLEPVKTNNVRITSGDVTLNNVQVQGQIEGAEADKHGIFIDGGKLIFQDVAVSDTSGSGIRHKGGVMTGTGLRLMDCGVYGISSSNGIVEGSVDVTGLQITGSASSNIHTDGQNPIRVTNGVLEVTNTNNVRVIGGTVTLTNVTIQGTEGNGNHGIFNSNGTVIAKHLTIVDTCDALRLDGGTMTVENGRLTNSRRHGVNINKGQLTLTNISVDGTKEHGIFSYGAEAAVKAENITMTGVSGKGVAVENGKVELNTLTVTASGKEGIYVTKGTVMGSKLVLEGMSGTGILAKDADANITITDLKINEKSGTADNNILAEGSFTGTMTLTDVTAGATTFGNMVISGGTLNLNNATLNGTVEKHHGIHVNGGTLNADGVTVKGAREGIYVSAGTADVKNSAIINSKRHGIGVGGGKLTLTNVSVKDSQEDGLNLWSTGQVILNQVTLTGNRNGILSGAETDVIFNSGCIYGNTALQINAQCALAIGPVTVGFDPEGNDLGGKIRSKNTVVYLGTDAPAQPVRLDVTGKSADQAIVKLESEEIAAQLVSCFKPVGGGLDDLSVVNDSLYLCQFVAQVGQDKYMTLAEAFEAANKLESATVTLLADAAVTETISVTGNVTLTDNGSPVTITRVTDGVMLQVDGVLRLEATAEGLLTVDGNDTAATGNAIKVNGQMTLDGAVFTNFKGGTYAGAILYLNTGSLMTAENATFTNNTGNLIYAQGRAKGENSHSFVDCSFADNYAAAAGSVFNSAKNAKFAITDCNFERNTSTGHGGAIYCDQSVYVIKNTTFKENKTTGGHGGALTASAHASANVTIEGCRFESNSSKENANGKGGAIWARPNSNLTVTDTAFVGNLSSKDGAAICCEGGSKVKIDGQTVSGSGLVAVDNDQ